MARGGREGAAPKDDEVELDWPARRYDLMAMKAYGASASSVELYVHWKLTLSTTI